MSASFRLSMRRAMTVQQQATVRMRGDLTFGNCSYPMGTLGSIYGTSARRALPGPAGTGRWLTLRWHTVPCRQFSKPADWVSHRLGVMPGMVVADLGCGVRGPFGEIARSSGATIVGVIGNAIRSKAPADMRKKTD